METETSMLKGKRSGAPEHDFTLAHYREILAAITASHPTLSFAEAAPLGRDLLARERFVLMRHDVELSLEGALALARADHEAGIRSTFFLQLGADYNLFEPESAALVRELLDLGHDLGLHYDLELLEQAGSDAAVVARRMIDLMEAFWATRVYAASPHLPMRAGRTLEIEGVVDVYDPLYFSDVKYLSDSTQSWREGVVTGLLSRYDRIQLLTHEYHWSEEGHAWDVLLLRAAMRKYERLYARAEANIVRFREGLRLRQDRDREFRARMESRRDD